MTTFSYSHVIVMGICALFYRKIGGYFNFVVIYGWLSTTFNDFQRFSNNFPTVFVISPNLPIPRFLFSVLCFIYLFLIYVLVTPYNLSVSKLHKFYQTFQPLIRD